MYSHCIRYGKMSTLSNNLACELKGITYRLVDASVMIGCNEKHVDLNGEFNYKLTWRQVNKHNIFLIGLVLNDLLLERTQAINVFHKQW